MKDYSNYYSSVIDTTISDGKLIFELQLNGIEGKDVFFNNELTQRKALIQRHTNPLNTSKKDYKISVRENESLNRGDIVKYKIRNYLVVSIPEENDMYKWADMENCNSLLNGIDLNGNIFSFPSIRKLASSSNSDTEENKYIQITSGDLVVRVQENEVTKNISRNTRFIFSKFECYKLKNIYQGLEDGIIILKMTQDELNEQTDKLVDYNGNKIWIANYEDRKIYNIKFNISDSDFSIGDTITLDYTITDNDEQIVDLPVTFTTSDENIVSINNNIATGISDGNATIKVELTNNTQVFDEIVLNVVTTPSDNISYELSPNLTTILRMENKTIEAKKINNGVEVAETFTFNIDSNTDIPSNKYEFEVIDNKSFRIKNLGVNGKLYIRVQPDNDIGNAFVKEYKFKDSYW